MNKQRIADALGIDISSVPDASPEWCDHIAPDNDPWITTTTAGKFCLTALESSVLEAVLRGETVKVLSATHGDFKPGTEWERDDEPRRPPNWEFMLPTEVFVDRDCFVRVPRAKAWLNDDGTVTFTRWYWDTSDGHDHATHRGLATVPAKVWDCYHAWWLKGWSPNKACPALMEAI